MGERSDNRTQETETGGAIGRPCAGIATTISAVEASVVIGRHGRRCQRHGDCGGQVSRPRSGDLRATLSVKAQIFALGNLNAFQASFYSLFHSIWRNDLVEHDPEASVAIQS